MKSIFKKSLGLCLVLFSTATFAQQRPAPGKVTGTVIDEDSKKAVEFATVSLFTSDSVLVSGGLTDLEGKFQISELKPGTYALQVSFMGYEPLRINDVILKRGEMVRDMGSIQIAPSTAVLEAVQVEAEQDFVVNSVDRKVYDVSKNLTTKGGSLSDVLENIPSVEVDMDGNVSLRGSSNVRIMINGKMSAMTSGAEVLQQIPSSSIERVEVITNPSAKYDAEGMAGILNIILKKNKDRGFNGSASVNGGNAGASSSASFNLMSEKLNWSTNYSFRKFARNFSYQTDRTTGTGDEMQMLSQNGNGQFGMGFHFLKTGLDYTINEQNSLSLSLSGSLRGMERPETVHNTYQQVSASSDYIPLSSGSMWEDEGHTYEAALSYQRTFKNPQKLYTFDINFSDNKGVENSNLWQEMQAVSAGFTDLTNKQVTEGEDNQAILSVQTDFTLPLANGSTFETGAKSQIRNMDEVFYFYNLNPEGTRSLDSEASTDLVFNEQVHAAYVNYRGEWKGIGYQAGLRAEQTIIDGDLPGEENDFSNRYLGLFPSIFLSKKFEKENELKLSYSKRINRPNSRVLSPVVNKSNSLDYRTGNPQLMPEQTHSLELSYGKYWGNTSLTSSLYYRLTTDVWQRFKRPLNDETVITTFENIGERHSYGLEVISVVPVTKWWKINSNLNVYRASIRDLENGVDNAAYSWSGALTNNFKLWKGMSLQLTGRYSSPRVLPQGEFSDIYYMDMAMSQQVLKNKGTFSLRFRDLFNTRAFEYSILQGTLEQNTRRKFQSQIIDVGFSYRFGKMQKPKRRRRSQGGGGRDNFSDVEVE